MPRQKKQILKKRKDGRYACRYKNQWFYSYISSDDALEQREQYIRYIKSGKFNQSVTVFEYGSEWLKIAYPAVSDATFKGLAIHLQHLVNRLGNTPIRKEIKKQIKCSQIVVKKRGREVPSSGLGKFIHYCTVKFRLNYA